jgi:hypothetical protein
MAKLLPSLPRFAQDTMQVRYRLRPHLGRQADTDPSENTFAYLGSKSYDRRYNIPHPITHVAMTLQDITVRHVPAPHPRPDEVHVGKGACTGGSLSEASRRTAQTQRKFAPRRLTHDAGTIHIAFTEHTVRRPTTSVKHMHEGPYSRQRAAHACMMQERDCADTHV